MAPTHDAEEPLPVGSSQLQQPHDVFDIVFHEAASGRRSSGMPEHVSPTTRPAPYGPIDHSVQVEMLLGREYRKWLPSAPSPIIRQALLASVDRGTARGAKLRELVSQLVDVRGEEMDSDLFNAVVVANWDTEGSGRELWRVISEMEKARVSRTSRLYTSFLRALAVHPNYYLRNLLLREMHMRWVELTGEGMCYVALGLIRDQQYELAYEKLDEMIRGRVGVEPWVVEIFVYTFTQRGFLDEALSILQQRLTTADEKYRFSSSVANLLHFLLDEGGRALHYQMTRYAWMEGVITNVLNPSDGIVLNALNTFSRHGDIELATKAIQFLSARNAKLGAHHYGALVDCYVHNEDLQNALQVLCIMRSAGLHTDKMMTRSIYSLLRNSPNHADLAVNALFLLSEKYEVPISALNVVIEALSLSGEVDRAIQLYQQVRHICRKGPNSETFEHLLAGRPRTAIIDFILSEMSTFDIRLQPSMRDHIVHSYAQDGDASLQLAFRTLGAIEDESRQRGAKNIWISRPTFLALVERCFKDEDPRVWRVIDEAQLRGMDVEEDVRRLTVKWDPATSPSIVKSATGQSTTV